MLCFTEEPELTLPEPWPEEFASLMTFKEELSILINTFRLFRLAIMYESLGDKVADVRDEDEDEDKADGKEEDEEEEEEGEVPELGVGDATADEPDDPSLCSKA